MTNQQAIIVLLLLSVLIAFCTPLPPLDRQPPLPHELSPILLPRMTEGAK